MISLGGRTNYRAAGAPLPTRIRREADFRDVAHRSRLGAVTNSSIGGGSTMPSGYEPAFQLVLPYFGLFSYSIGRQSWLIDSSKILLIRPGWEFADGQPVKGLGHSSLLLNPTRSIAEEIFGSRLFARREVSQFGPARSSPSIWLQTQYFLAQSHEGLTALQADEWMIRVMDLTSDQPRIDHRPSTRTVARAKEFLHAHGFERVPLERIAGAVGVSAVYLSNEFTRTEGIPLYQYQLYLRLVRSLQRLRDCDDITQLALELGFSSHSHFSATFRRTFGLSPSQYRLNIGSRRSVISATTLSRIDGILGTVGRSSPTVTVR